MNIFSNLMISSVYLNENSLSKRDTYFVYTMSHVTHQCLFFSVYEVASQYPSGHKTFIQRPLNVDATS